MPEAMLFAMDETENRKVFLESIEISVLVPHYFLLTVVQRTIPPHVIELAGEAIHQIEERGGGAFYAFVTKPGRTSLTSARSFRGRCSYSPHNLAKFFRIISASARCSQPNFSQPSQRSYAYDREATFDLP